MTAAARIPTFALALTLAISIGSFGTGFGAAATGASDQQPGTLLQPVTPLQPGTPEFPTPPPTKPFPTLGPDIPTPGPHTPTPTHPPVETLPPPSATDTPRVTNTPTGPVTSEPTPTLSALYTAFAPYTSRNHDPYAPVVTPYAQPPARPVDAVENALQPGTRSSALTPAPGVGARGATH